MKAGIVMKLLVVKCFLLFCIFTTNAHGKTSEWDSMGDCLNGSGISVCLSV